MAYVLLYNTHDVVVVSLLRVISHTTQNLRANPDECDNVEVLWQVGLCIVYGRGMVNRRGQI